VDQLLYLAQSPAQKVACALRTVASLGDADDVVKIVIETEKGTILDLDINMASAHPLPPWLVMGQYGSMIWDPERKAWHVRYYRPEEAPPPRLYTELVAPDRKYPRDEIPWHDEYVETSEYEAVDYYEQCYAYFCRDEPPFVPIAETRELIRVLSACRQAAEPGSIEGA
jgi:predicted dehydrogenase